MEQRTLAIILILAILILAGALGYMFLTRTPASSLPSPLPTLAIPVAPPPPLLASPSPLPTLAPSPATAEPVTTSRRTDTSRFFSVEIPTTWRITADEGKKGLQLSRITAETPDFRVRQDSAAEQPFTPQYYETGAHMSLRALKDVVGPTRHGQTLRTETITVDGRPGTYHVYKEPSTFQGQLLDVHVTFGGTEFLFEFAYNPATYPDGEEVFKAIVNSVRFL